MIHYKHMQIVGHRGAPGMALENTRDSFQAAIRAGVDWIEFDVRATSDGHVVVFHDPHTLRMSGKFHVISRTPLAALQRLRLHGNQSMPTLSEALNSIGGQAKVMIEIKSAGCGAAVVNNIMRLINKGVRYDEFRVGSFKPEWLRQVWELNPQIPLVLFHRPHRPLRFLHVKGLELKGVGFYYHLLPRSLIELAHLHGLEVYAFPIITSAIDTPSRAQAKRLARRGVDIVATNRPGRLRNLSS